MLLNNSEMFFVYLDDILIFFPFVVNTHQSHVHQVLHHLLQNHLYAKAEKCVFQSASVSFISFISG